MNQSPDLSHLFTSPTPDLPYWLAVKTLPRLFQAIRAQLTPDELSSLDQFALQSYLVEISLVKPKSFDPSALVAEVSAHIRASSRFWVKDSEVYTQLTGRQDLAQGVSKAVEEYKAVLKLVQTPVASILVDCPSSLPPQSIPHAPSKQFLLYHTLLPEVYKMYPVEQQGRAILKDFLIYLGTQNQTQCEVAEAPPRLKLLTQKLLQSKGDDGLYRLMLCKSCLTLQCDYHQLVQYSQSGELCNKKAEAHRFWKDLQAGRREQLQQKRVVNWSEEQYRRFLLGLKQYFTMQVNNRKIAKFMGADVDPHDVKRVKGRYLRGLKHRAEQRKVRKEQMLESDIGRFSMDYFKAKFNRPKRASSKSSSEEVVRNYRRP